MAVEAFEMEIAVEPADIDLLGHVNNVVYLRWVQDLAVAHWYNAATAQQQASLLWIVARHEIDYKRPAFAGDIVAARTWVGSAHHHLFERFTEFRRKADGKLLARALTLWTPVDRDSKRVVDVGPDVYETFAVNR
ncbi:MAG: acyl-CoA thioesterase [Gammaproteobacteria bacterium]|nr:acyl-CoA thioesterase [Gammaproteobacteria bacterium]